MINKNSYIPMYEQVANELREDIVSNNFNDNGNIGSQKELVDRFNVSVITIRKALSILEKEGLIIRKQGKGTFANKTLFQDNLKTLTGLSNVISEKGFIPDIEIRTFEIIETPKCFDEQVKMGLEEKCLYIERIHKIENIPVGIAQIYIPYKIGVELSKYEIEKYTIYEIYENKLGIELGKGTQTIKANKADKYLTDILLVEEKSPVLEVERLAFDDKGKLIEYIILSYEYDKYEFKVELQLSSNKTYDTIL